MEKQSILNTIKKVIGLDKEYVHFDEDLIVHINAAFSTLHDLGVGPANSFSISDDKAVWGDYGFSEPYLEMIKQYVYLKVRLVFDPPQTSYAIESLTKFADQLEWRLHTQAETETYRQGVFDDDF